MTLTCNKAQNSKIVRCYFIFLDFSSAVANFWRNILTVLKFMMARKKSIDQSGSCHGISWLQLNHLVLCGVISWSSCIRPSQAAELSYSLQSPQLGGNNTALYQVESARVSNIRQQNAQRIAEQKAAEQAAAMAAANTTAARFASALQSQLFMSVSQQISQRVSELQQGQSGSFRSGDVMITYTKLQSSISVQIATPTGTTNIELPTGF